MAERSRGLAGAAGSAVRVAAKAVRERVPGKAPRTKSGRTTAAAANNVAVTASPSDGKVTKKAAPRKAAGTTSAPAAQQTTAATRNVATKRSVATKPVAKKPSTKAPATKGRSTSAAAKKTAAKTTAVKKSAVKKSGGKTTAVKTTAVKTTATRAPARKAVTAAAATKVAPAALKVREDEAPWTAEELAGVHSELEAELGRLAREVEDADEQIAELIRDSGDGAGDDQADSGSKAFEREHEMTLANNARELLAQNRHALERIDDGTYGICESCGNPIGKRRLQVFPRATLCVACKQKQERH
jgi:RNA polymerase-binding protein DksA